MATTLFLLLLALFMINYSHARLKTPPSSVVLGMTHTRALSPPASSPEGLGPLETLDMMELRGFRDGYLITLDLGAPSQVLQVYMDTGSDLTWVPCGNISFECMACEEYYRTSKLMATFSPTYSSSSLRDLCTSPFCTNIHSSDNAYDPCTMAGCSLSTLLSGTCPRPCPSFSYTYGGGTLIIGSLTRDTLRFPTRDVSSFCFGCVGSTFREPIGIAGFGKGTLSLPWQLGFIKKGFSHCFLGFKFANNPNISSPLVIGELAISSKDIMQFTPMLKSPMFPSLYYIGLDGISVGNDTPIEVPLSLRSFDSDGNGAFLIDSGTTYTHLPEPFYSRVLSEVASKVKHERSSDDERRTGFDLCYKVPCHYNITNTCSDEFPYISFHFLNNVQLVMPRESCFYAVGAMKDSMVVKCLLFQSMDDDEAKYGPAGVFGSFQQQNVEVVYDLEKERIGLQPMDCAAAAAYHGLHNQPKTLS